MQDSQVRTGDVFVNQDAGAHYDYDDDDDYDDIDDDDDGIFEDEESIFNGQRTASDSDMVTRAQEDVPSNTPGSQLPAVQRKLVAVFAADGSMQVAETRNGQRAGPWRPPSPSEWELFKERGRIVKHGATPSGAAVPPSVGAVEEKPGGSLWKKAAVGLVTVGAVGGLAYYAYRSYQKSKDEEDLDEGAKAI